MEQRREACLPVGRFEVVVQTYSMNEAEISEYCRKRGIYPEQIAAWRQTCKKANATAGELEKSQRSIAREEKKKVKELSRELRRKDKALAEAAALLILKKKPRHSGGIARTKSK